MSGNMYGADIAALRRLADRIAQGGEALDGVVGVVESAMPAPEQWSGMDAENFRDEWYGSHGPSITATAGTDRRRSDVRRAGPGGGRVSGTTQGSGNPVEAKRLARNSTMLALTFLALAAFAWFGWWNAQVNHIEGPRSKGFTEGDPFPWFLVYPLAGLGIWFVITTIRQWARYFRMPATRP